MTVLEACGGTVDQVHKELASIGRQAKFGIPVPRYVGVQRRIGQASIQELRVVVKHGWITFLTAEACVDIDEECESLEAFRDMMNDRLQQSSGVLRYRKREAARNRKA